MDDGSPGRGRDGQHAAAGASIVTSEERQSAQRAAAGPVEGVTSPQVGSHGLQRPLREANNGLPVSFSNDDSYQVPWLRIHNKP